MQHLQEINYNNSLNQIDRGTNFLEAEYKELLNYQVRIDEHDENTLNQIFADVERRIDAARRGLSIAGKLKDPTQRKEHVAKMMGHLNRTRALLDRVVKEFYPEKVDVKDDSEPKNKRPEEYITPQQAAETLGIHPSKLQSLVMSNQLRMYNDNGRWALKGADVQALVGKLNTPTEKPKSSGYRSDFMQHVK